MKDDSLKNKIAGLLAKAERTDNEHERDAFNAKAEALMLKYGIEQAELQAAGKIKPDEIIEVRLEFVGIYAIIMPAFAWRISNALGGINVLKSKSYDGKTYYAYIIGHKSDVESMQILLASLQLQAQSAMKRWWKTSELRSILSNMDAYKARRQFIASFAIGAADRIRSERRTEEATVSTGAALVLVSRQEKVDKWMHEQHNVVKSRGGADGSAFGGAAGRAAGRQANVGTTGVSGGRKALNG